jgi:hypothetical protein
MTPAFVPRPARSIGIDLTYSAQMCSRADETSRSQYQPPASSDDDAERIEKADEEGDERADGIRRLTEDFGGDEVS